VLAPETPIEATADAAEASETSDNPVPPETSEAPAPDLTDMALPLAVPIGPQLTASPPIFAPPAPTAATPVPFTEGATAPDPAPVMASDSALPDLGAAVRTGEAVTALALPQPAISAAPVSTPVSAPLPQPLDLSAQHWPEQMVQDIRQSALGSTDSLTLTLTPERLGTLHIRLEMQDGLTHVHIVTETPEAARALAEAQPRLAEAMTRAGLEMGNQSTGTSGGSGATGGDASPRNGGQPTPDTDTLPPNHPLADGPPPGPAPRHTSRSSIDLIA
jgi:flagellar hook-length control protein FliK